MESAVVSEETTIKEASESLLKDIGDEIKNPRLMMYIYLDVFI